MANIAIGLFSPMKHELREYLGYDITKFKDNIRFAEILLNRGGSPGSICPLFFDGAVNTFSELPKPNDIQGLNKVYTYIDKLRSKKGVSFFIKSLKLLFK